MPTDDQLKQGPQSAKKGGGSPAPTRRAASGRRQPGARGKTPAIAEGRQPRAAGRPVPTPPALQASPRPLPRLLAKYREEVLPTLVGEFDYTSPMQAPRMLRMILNIGLGEALQNPRALEMATAHLAIISGQRPVVTKARRSVAGFKLRQGMSIGCMATLRGYRMYDFLDRLLNMALPRIRDFRGVSRSSLDGQGNYSLGIREQAIFAELDYNQIDRIRGLQVVMVTSARSDREGMRLLELLGMPFVRDGQQR